MESEVAQISDNNSGLAEINSYNISDITIMQNEILSRYNLSSNSSPMEIQEICNIVEQNKADAEHCSICLMFVTPLRNLYYPCRCPFFKVHKKCLPSGKYMCNRCGVYYGKGILYASWMRFFFFGQCRATVNHHTRQRCNFYTFRSRYCLQHR